MRQSESGYLICTIKMKHCELCNGEGTVPVDVFDPDSGQMMRGVGTQVCECGGKLKVAEDEMDDDSGYEEA